jgi:hypothetical protein
MRFSIAPVEGYLRAELIERETGAETREFLEALVAACLEHKLERVLIFVRASRPIFKVEQYAASLHLRELSRRPGARVALVASRPDLRAAHEYLEVLAGQHGANLRSFSHEALAAEWLRSEQPAAARAPGKAASKSP